MIEQVKIKVVLKDGSIAIISFVVDDHAGVKKEATKENIEHEISRYGLDVKSWSFIEDKDIPQDRTFRNAWKSEGKGVGVDMVKAREIHKEHLRELRIPLLEKLDIEYQKADERGDLVKKQEIAQRKQELRDITIHPDIEKAKTPEELKTVGKDIF